MKILFIANQWMGIYKNIQDEMVRQGHQVSVIPDKIFSGDPYSRYKKRWYSSLRNRNWNNKIKKYWISKDQEIKGGFDILFVISGTSLNEWSVDYIKSLNPGMKTIFYTWDNCDYYQYDRHLAYFDKTYTFDIEDTKKNKKWSLLPIPYSIINKSDADIEYDLFGLGSDHSERLFFYKKIFDQVNNSGIKIYLKLVTHHKSFVTVLKSYLLQKDKMAFQKRRLIKSKDMSQLILLSPISNEVYNELIAKSRCIIDDARPNQSGLTARFMWALGMGKKIVTTNRWALDYEFVDPCLVKIIDNNNPKIPYDFFKSYDEENTSSQRKLMLANYSYSNWVKIVLS